MPKNIVVFSDGTGQDGGVRPEQPMSNVYKLYRACRIGPENSVHPGEQVAFYDPGLGTDAMATGLTKAYRTIQKLLASVTGLGITKNIADCYEFIINHWEPGDRIFLIGFSRGAYTARCVANVLWLCGVPTRDANGELARFRKATRDVADEAVLEVYEYGAGYQRSRYESERNENTRRFRFKYGSGDDLQSNVAPHFIGVFDTVASLGATGVRRWVIGIGLTLLTLVTVSMPAVLIDLTTRRGFWWPFLACSVALGAFVLSKWLPTAVKTIHDSPVDHKTHRHIAQWRSANYDRLLSGHVNYARSANAIDETRADFDRVGWGSVKAVRGRVDGEPEPLIQMWFAGNHSDIGGSYPEVESRLSDIALDWMIEQAKSIPGPLLIEDDQPHRFPSPDGVQHCEIAGMRDAVEALTPSFLRRFTRSVTWKEKVRDITSNAMVHPSVKERFDLPCVVQCAGSGPYRPKALIGHNDFKEYYASAPEFHQR
jgi:uncharacterized protein (DUF2235 family)